MLERLIKLEWWPIVRMGLIVVIINKAVVFFAVAVYVIAVVSWGIIWNGGVAFVTQDATLFSQDFLTYFQIPIQIELFTQLSEWGSPALSILMAAAGAARLGRQVESRADWHGLALGGFIAIITVYLDWLMGVQPGGIFSFKGFVVFGMTIAAGWIGGVPVHEDLTHAELLVKASQAIRSAETFADVMKAVGENLATEDIVSVSLWHVVNQDEAGVPLEFMLVASWLSGEAEPKLSAWEVGVRYNSLTQLPSWQALRNGRPFVIQLDEVSTTERESWRQLGVRSMAVLPLNARFSADLVLEEPETGMILIGSSRTYGLKESILSKYLAVDSQVSLMLENIQLMRQARQTGVLQERQRLAHEIHDTLAQGFTSIVMHLEAADQSFPSRGKQVKHHVHLARQMARDGLDQARRLVWALRPQPLEKASLPEALQRVLQKWTKQTRVVGKFHVTGTEEAIHPDIDVSLLRILQEALANIGKYAQATEVNVTLSYLDGLIVMDIHDNGVGFDYEQMRHQPSSRQGGFGLAGMERRVKQLDGSFDVESEIGEGTTVAVAIPFA